MPILQIEFDDADALLVWSELANSLSEGHKFPKRKSATNSSGRG